jgi:hypothetical protein
LSQKSSLADAIAGAIAEEAPKPAPPPILVVEKGTERHRRVGIALSIALHCLLLSALALQVMSNRSSEPVLETFIQSGPSSGGAPVGDPIAMDLGPLMPAAKSKAPAALALAADSLVAAGVSADLPNVGQGGQGGKGGSGGGTGTGVGTGVGSGFLNLPHNAVQAGSFAAWTTPQGVDNLRRRFKPKGEPGDSPAPGELYYITIQIKLPRNHSVYTLTDLSGEVVGTDKYRQRIPQGIYMQDEEGNLVRPPRSGKIKVEKGVVEFIMVVPGAAKLVEDTIEVSSKELEESQTLTLTFDG